MRIGKLVPLIFVILVFCILGVGYCYFFIISPTFVNKPDLEIPLVIEGEEVTEEQVFYVLNELDAYKLHGDPFSDEPAIIELQFEDSSMLVEIIDNNFVASDNMAPDIIIEIPKEEVINLINEEDFDSAVIELYSNGIIDVDIVADEATLALKGYKSLYDNFASNEITGNLVKLDAITYTKGLNLSLLFFIALILHLIMEKI